MPIAVTRRGYLQLTNLQVSASPLRAATGPGRDNPKASLAVRRNLSWGLCSLGHRARTLMLASSRPHNRHADVRMDLS